MKTVVHCIFVFLTLFFFQTSQACTTFNLTDADSNVFGKNYDWYPDDGVWSITFNQYGREFPTGGINEAGLVVEAMTVPGTEYPAPIRRDGVSSMT